MPRVFSWLLEQASPENNFSSKHHLYFIKTTLYLIEKTKENNKKRNRALLYIPFYQPFPAQLDTYLA